MLEQSLSRAVGNVKRSSTRSWLFVKLLLKSYYKDFSLTQLYENGHNNDVDDSGLYIWYKHTAKRWLEWEASHKSKQLVTKRFKTAAAYNMHKVCDAFFRPNNTNQSNELISWKDLKFSRPINRIGSPQTNKHCSKSQIKRTESDQQTNPNKQNIPAPTHPEFVRLAEHVVLSQS